MKKVELLQDLLEVAYAINQKSDAITEFFGADEIEFLDDEEKMLLETIYKVANVTDAGHQMHLEDKFYDYLFGKFDIDTMLAEIVSVHAEVNPDYRELIVFDDEQEGQDED